MIIHLFFYSGQSVSEIGQRKELCKICLKSGNNIFGGKLSDYSGLQLFVVSSLRFFRASNELAKWTKELAKYCILAENRLCARKNGVAQSRVHVKGPPHVPDNRGLL